MNRSNTTLSCHLRNQEEVEALVAFAVLDESSINDGSRFWILSISISSISEHSLVDPLVHNYQGNWRWSTYLIVDWFESFLELSDFFFNDLVSHLLSNTVSVDDKLGWRLTIMIFLEFLNSTE